MRLLRYFILACAVTTWSAAVAWAGECPASGGCPMSAAQCKAATAAGTCTADMKAQCARRGASAAAAAAKGCPMHGGAATAAMMGCGAHSAAHAACTVCEDDAACDADVRTLGAHEQVVALRNGAMIVYTIDNPASVHALQAAVARHNGRVVAALEGQGAASLCADCKQMRGAMASGKLTREVVNLERGCQLLLTSSDPAIVLKIHAAAGGPMTARTGS